MLQKWMAWAMKYKDNKDVLPTSTFTFLVISKTVGFTKPKYIGYYNLSGVTLKDQKLQTFLIERKRGIKWYMTHFKHLPNVEIQSAYVVYNKLNSLCQLS
jgi:hypothetical protein